MTDIQQRPSYKSREVFDALLKALVYEKLKGDYLRGQQIFVPVRDVAKILDPENFGATKYTKYWVINKMQRGLQFLEDQMFIARDLERIAVDNLTLEHLREATQSEKDSDIFRHMEEYDG